MAINEEKIGEVLIKVGAINALDLAKAAQHQKKAGGTLTDALIAVKAVSAEEMGRIAATMLKLPFVSLRAVSIPPEIVKLLPEGIAQKYRSIPLKAEGRKFWVAMSQPMNMDHIDALRFRLNGDVYPVVTPETEMEQGLEFYYGKLKHPPLSLPPSSGLAYAPEQFDIRRHRAAQKAQQAPAPAPRPAPAAPAAAAPVPAPVAQAAPQPPPEAAPQPAPVVEEPLEVLELIPEPEAPAAENAQPSDEELIAQLANFLLGK